MTPQQKMEEKLKSLPIPHRETQCYGRQITVECHSRKAAEKFAHVLGKFSKVRGIIETTVEAKQNAGTCLNPTMIAVWRVYAAIT